MRFICLSLFLLFSVSARAEGLTVFAAASLTDALKDVATIWVAAGHAAPRLSFASSSTLARQISQGAPVNVFASADEKWMDYLDEKNLIARDTRQDLLGNRLVLVVPANHPRQVTLAPHVDLLSILGPDGRLAVGDPSHVPAGIYAAQALKSLGIWEQLENRLARAADVRSALLFVQRGETPAGIVYATDAAVTKDVAVAGVFPENTHTPIAYPFAVVKAGDTPDARQFLTFLHTTAARDIFVRRGFRTE